MLSLRHERGKHNLLPGQREMMNVTTEQVVTVGGLPQNAFTDQRMWNTVPPAPFATRQTLPRLAQAAVGSRKQFRDGTSTL
jgi:hypothetical protein